MWLTGPVALRHVGSSQTRARTRVPCIGRHILNHCATREALKDFLRQIGEKILLPSFQLLTYSDLVSGLHRSHCPVYVYVGCQESRVHEFGISRCKLYVGWINNEVLLYSTGHYIQYPVVNHNGKEYEKECIHMYN